MKIYQMSCSEINESSSKKNKQTKHKKNKNS